MAIYKLFPSKDTSIYSFYPTKNAGLDEILDISLYDSINNTAEVSRALLAFPNSEIIDILSTKVGAANYKAYLKLYLATASEIPLDYTLYCHPISGSWNMGTGRTANSPEVSDGASWKYRNYFSGSGFFVLNTEATSSYRTNIGGGTWYTGSNLVATQSFTYSTDKDIEIDITNAISSSYYQNGFILKHSSSLEFNTSSFFETKYFSVDTHTIYPPCLEIRWNDFIYSTGSLSTVSTDNIVITISNNKGVFQETSVNRFRVNVRDQYPSTAFRTTLSYANSKALPSSSYWSIKDLDTEEIVVDYDTSYTKLSCDGNGNYFDIYMNGLEPERYYKLLIKTIINNKEVIVSDKDYIFKVIR